MTQSASSNHKWTRYSIASCYFRILIWESRVSDSGRLGKTGVALGFVVLSDTVFGNNSQQGGPDRGLKCHGKWCHMSNLILVFHRILTVEMKYELLRLSEDFLGYCCIWKAGVTLWIPNLLSNLPPLSCVVLTSDWWSCSASLNILSSILGCLTIKRCENRYFWCYFLQ